MGYWHGKEQNESWVAGPRNTYTFHIWTGPYYLFEVCYALDTSDEFSPSRLILLSLCIIAASSVADKGTEKEPIRAEGINRMTLRRRKVALSHTSESREHGLWGGRNNILLLSLQG